MRETIPTISILEINKNFSEALTAVKQGRLIWRSGWNGKTQYVEMQVPDANSKMTSPYLFITSYRFDPMIGIGRTPWVPSQGDVLGEDWVIGYVGA